MKATVAAALALGLAVETLAVELPDYLQRHKLPAPVLRPTGRKGDFDSAMVDCPQVFRHDERWHMAYTGFDGDAYRMGLAVSDDLVHWTRLKMIFDCGPKDAWDYGSVGGGSVYPDGQGGWLLVYCAFPKRGYEVGPGKHGLARAKALAGPYVREPRNPILLPSPGNQWDSGGLYKPILARRGDTWYLFYNAKDRRGREQTGVATGPDLLHLTKHDGNPILAAGPQGSWDSWFASDPALLKIGGVWHMFYYGFDRKHAQDGVAVCVDDDWLKWEKFAGNPILRVGPPGSLDEVHAHKPFVVEWQGVHYHFYCSVGKGGRCVALATSKPLEAGDTR